MTSTGAISRISFNGRCYVVDCEVDEGGGDKRRRITLDNHTLLVTEREVRLAVCPNESVKKDIFKKAILRGWTCLRAEKVEKKVQVREIGTSTDDLGVSMSRVTRFFDDKLSMLGERSTNTISSGCPESPCNDSDTSSLGRMLNDTVAEVRDCVDNSLRDYQDFLKDRLKNAMAKLEQDTSKERVSDLERSTETSKEAARRADSGNVVYFDLETTGLGTECSIIQIGAYASRDDGLFNVFTLPHGPIELGATAVHGFEIDPSSGGLTRRGCPIETATCLANGLRKFLDFLGNYRPVFLVAHNNFAFDMPIILRHFARYGLLDECKKIVTGFGDSLPLFRNLVPSPIGHALETLSRKYLKAHANQTVHDALADSGRLMALARHFEVDDVASFVNNNCTMTYGIAG